MFEGIALVSVLAAGLLLLGVRHGFDVDHITAIDNLVRMHNASRRSRLVGTGFAVGHIMAVLLEVVAVVLVLGSVASTSQIGYWGGAAGAAALGAIGLLNIYSLRRWGRTGSSMVAARVLARVGHLGPIRSAVLTGIVFGLGFDTATQIAAIALSSTASVSGGLAASIAFLAPFSCGMIATDTIDSLALRFAFARIVNTRGFGLMSYALSVTALVVSISNMYGLVFSVQSFPEWAGAALAATVIGGALFYALEHESGFIRRALGGIWIRARVAITR